MIASSSAFLASSSDDSILLLISVIITLDSVTLSSDVYFLSSVFLIVYLVLPIWLVTDVNSRLRDSTSDCSDVIEILVLISFSLDLKEVRVSLLVVIVLSSDSISSCSLVTISSSSVV